MATPTAATDDMDEKLFTPLNRDSREIRLLRLVPAQHEDEIIYCSMETYSLDSPPQYTALSYEWGDVDDQDAIAIEVNGCSMRVQQNLWQFLRCAVRRQDTCDTLLWIDALCINQAQSDEQSHQVNMMAQIYEGAELVIAWLGPRSHDSDMAMDYIKSFMESWTSNRKLQSEVPDTVLNLCHRNYWSRLWVLQELVFAQSCIMWVGNRSMPLNYLEALLGQAALNVSAADMAPEEAPEVYTSRNLLESLAGSMLKQRQRGPGAMTLIERVRTCVTLKCSDPRDKVYALLGISRPSGVFADYTVTLSSLFNDLLNKSGAFDSCTDLNQVSRVREQFAGIIRIDSATLFPALRFDDQGIVENHPDINAYPMIHRESGISLWWVLAFNHLHVQRLWFQEAIEEYYGALRKASNKGNTGMARTLLDVKADSDPLNPRLRTSLQAALSRGDNEMVRRLINVWTARVHIGDWTEAMFSASLLGNDEEVRLLLDVGADANASRWSDESSLHAASRRGHEKVVQMLLEAGANVNVEGLNTLQNASRRGHERVVQTLLEAGADVHAYRPSNERALYAASLNGHARVAQILIKAGSNVNRVGGRHGTALQAASFEGHDQVVMLLLDNGADFGHGDTKYPPALQAASYSGHTHIVRMLLDTMKHVDVPKRWYIRALDSAKSQGHAEVVHVLTDYMFRWQTSVVSLGRPSHDHEGWDESESEHQCCTDDHYHNSLKRRRLYG